MNDIRLGIQLYSLRNTEDMREQILQARSAGFDHIETIGAHLVDADLRATARTANVQIMSGHVGIEQVREDPDAIVATAQACSIDRLFIPGISKPERPQNTQEFIHFGAELGELSQRFQKGGIELG